MSRYKAATTGRRSSASVPSAWVKRLRQVDLTTTTVHGRRLGPVPVKAVGGYLAEQADPDGVIPDLDRDRMSAETGLSPTLCRRAMPLLERHGWIQKTSRNPGGHWGYRLTIPANPDSLATASGEDQDGGR